MLTGWRRQAEQALPASRRAARDPFAALGLDPAADLGDDEVRAAWRRIAAETHPDRADGGDPERFALAAAAYTELRTRHGRGEARASLAAGGWPDPAGQQLAAHLTAWRALAGIGSLVRHGRPVRLGARVLAAAAAAVLAVFAAGPGPAGPALVTGAATWLVLTGRRDLGRPGQPGSGPVATGRDGSADQADHEPT